jgi:hypothetical protein
MALSSKPQTSPTLCRLYTLHVRKDRFCEGHFAAMLANGHIAALTRRLKAIREDPAHGG